MLNNASIYIKYVRFYLNIILLNIHRTCSKAEILLCSKKVFQWVNYYRTAESTSLTIDTTAI